MASDYYYELNDGCVIVIVVDELGPANAWSSHSADNCLVIEGGFLDVEAEGTICRAGVTPFSRVLTLKGANWDSEVGDEGDVDPHLVSDCNPTRWILTRLPVTRFWGLCGGARRGRRRDGKRCHWPDSAGIATEPRREEC